MPIDKVDGEPEAENYDNPHDRPDKLEFNAFSVSVTLAIMTTSTLTLLALAAFYSAFFVCAEEGLAIARNRTII